MFYKTNYFFPSKINWNILTWVDNFHFRNRKIFQVSNPLYIDLNVLEIEIEI